jgi:hypothetical protein
MRTGEGFELPIVEGLLTNCRPIALDIECYRHWFDGLAIFVKESFDKSEMTTNIIEAVNNFGDPTVSEQDREYVAEKFDAKKIYTEMWQEIMKGIA